jgi:hypothetical protein
MGSSQPKDLYQQNWLKPNAEPALTNWIRVSAGWPGHRGRLRGSHPVTLFSRQRLKRLSSIYFVGKFSSSDRRDKSWYNDTHKWV